MGVSRSAGGRRSRAAVLLCVVGSIVASLVAVPAAAGAATGGVASTPPAYDTAVRTDAPVSWWPLDEATGAAARDLTGPNAGLVQGGVTPGVTGPFGEGSRAFRFDGGACSGVDVGRQPASMATAHASIEPWFRTTAASSGIMFRWRNHGYGFESVSGGLQADGWPGGNGSSVRGGTGAADGNWHHGVGQWTGTAWQVFLDGVKVGETAGSGDLYYD